MKAKVNKSNSSNSNIKKEMGKKDKKCRSNADIQDSELKKKPSNSNEEVEDAPKRPKTIRRPGRKRFLPFVLTMLSKSTTGTQFPDAKIKKNKLKTRKRKIYDDNLIGDLGPDGKSVKYKSKVLNEENINKENEHLIVLQSKKDIIQTPSDDSQWSTRDPLKLPDFPPLVPKIGSYNNNLSISKEQRIVEANKNTFNDKGTLDTEITSENHKKLLEYINFSNNNEKFALENKKQNENQLAIVDINKDPITLVSEDNKKDSKLYNFFVDLLETTFNIYNVNTEFENATAEDNQIASQITWNANEIENKKSNTAVNVEHQDETNYLNIYDEDWDDKLLDDVETMNLRDLSPEKPLIRNVNRQTIYNNNRRSLQYSNQSSSRSIMQANPRRRPQNATRSFIQNNSMKNSTEEMTLKRNTDLETIYRDVSPQQSIIRERRRIKPRIFLTRRPLQPVKSFDYPVTGRYKKHSKSYQKKTFLNILKEQLTADDTKYVEPQNLFEALQVMARYKKKCQKSIRFEERYTKDDGDEIKQCMYKRRELISSGRKLNNYPNRNLPKKPTSTNKKMKTTAKKSRPVIIRDYAYGSNHSLQVYNDYTAETLSNIFY